MAKEIERKFLVATDKWKNSVARQSFYAQGYLSYDPERTVRVRETSTTGFLTIKGMTVGLSRDEFEYEIPKAEAAALLEMCEQPPVQKMRYFVEVGKHTWEIDVFEGANAGLVVAEIELASEDEVFECPEWLGEEVSGDRRYSNSSLNLNPFKSWSEGEK
ncbi:MAG: hypothetical protein RL754_866 [Bacteroidota bacterium]|jgi:adenylate cyclase